MEHPEKIGKYKITRALGKGAMGMVYEGFDPVIERKVAIKTILSEYVEAAELEEAQARFKREAQAAGRLQHPGIVAVYEYGTDGEMAFIVMEYVEGKELRRILATGMRYELIEVFEIMKHLLSALDYSHKQGVVHRDIKPANLMVLSGPKVKVMDFGIARLESSSLTQAGTVVGTPTHMSPEQLMGLPADGRADIWSAGVILYELLTGQSPFVADTPATVMHKVLQADPPPPTTLAPGLPKGFDAVLARALAKKADDRFQTAREFQAGLLAALQGKPMGAPAPRRERPAPADATLAAAPRASRVTLSADALADIERALSSYIGPLAGVLVRRGQGEAPSDDAFLKSLAAHIADESEQSAFLKKVGTHRKAAATSAPTASDSGRRAQAAAQLQETFTPEVLSTAERALASFVGPLAKFLIKDAASQTGNVKELYAQLATHIDSEEERRAFLATLRAK